MKARLRVFPNNGLDRINKKIKKALSKQIKKAASAGVLRKSQWWNSPQFD